MTEIDSEETLRPHTSIVANKVGDEYILLHLETGLYHGLDGVGTLIWEKLSAGEPLTAIKQSITAKYEVSDEVAERDLRALIEEMLDADIVIQT